MERSSQAPIDVENSQKEQRSNMESCNQAPIDVENPRTLLAISMTRKFEALSPLSSECCIYRVSKSLRSSKEKAYTPQVVSIGPLHHGKDDLKAMEELKMRYLGDYINRTGESLEHYINIVWDYKSKLRGCYEETIEFIDDKFVEIILVDSAFIIEVLLRLNIVEFQKKRDRVFTKSGMLSMNVWTDLFLLENQLPFFILDKLFNPKILPESKKEFSIVKLSYKFFASFKHWEDTQENLNEMSSTNIKHFVHFLKKLLVPVSPREGGKCEKATIPSITNLDYEGVKFKVRPSKNLLDIHFKNGILEIPKLRMVSGIDLILRNLIVFEQYHCNDNYINDYVWILDNLINTPEDLELLTKYGIMEIVGEKSDVCTIINTLGGAATMIQENFYFADIFKKLNDYNEKSWHKWEASYYKKSWHKWKANLMKNYFNTPWGFFSVIAAVLIIILTVIQAICSIISVI